MTGLQQVTASGGFIGAELSKNLFEAHRLARLLAVSTDVIADEP